MCVRAASLRSRSAGFTLVELMVVVAVIGVGGGLALFNMSEQVADARAKADGHAMMERIRQEHRAAKERMTGLILRPVGDKLVFTPAKKCQPIIDTAGAQTEVQAPFMTSTKLIIAGAEFYCWDEQGRPRPEVLASDTEPGDVVVIPGNPNFPGNPAPDAVAPTDGVLPTMGIFVEMSNPAMGMLTPIHVTQTGVSAGPGVHMPTGDVENAVSDLTHGTVPSSPF